MSRQSPYASASPLNLPSSATKASQSNVFSSSSKNGTPDTSMLFVGQPCSSPTCHREEFLPLKCPDCGSSFCSDHFNQTTHNCSYALHPERKGHGTEGNFLVPICPLCSEVPQGWRREDLKTSQDVEKVLVRHVETLQCVALLENGKRRNVGQNDKGTMPICGERNCGKRLVVDIRCEDCKLLFCPSHRAPRQHRCGAKAHQQQQSQSSACGALSAMRKLAISNNSSNKDNAPAVRPPQAKGSAPSNTASSSSSSPFNFASRIEDKKIDRWVPPPIFSRA